MNPLLAPPLLALRLLDDVHTLARAAQDTSGFLNTIEPEQVDAALSHLAALAAAAERLSEIEANLAKLERRALKRADGLERQLASLVHLAERIEGGLPSIGRVLDGIAGLEKRIAGTLATVERLEHDIASVGRLAPSVDVLSDAAERLAATAAPLQGAAERLGRITDRLPRAARTRT